MCLQTDKQKPDVTIGSRHFASRNTDEQHKSAGSVYKSILSCDVTNFHCQPFLLLYLQEI